MSTIQTTTSTPPARVPAEDAPETGGSSAYADGQAAATEFNDAINDPGQLEIFFQTHASQLADPDYAAGFLSSIPADTVKVYVKSEFNGASDEQNVAFTEALSNALGAASRSGQLPEAWVDDFFSGMNGSGDERWAASQLMRTGDFSTEFLTRAVRDVVSIADDPGAYDLTTYRSNANGSGLNWIMSAVARNPEASSLVTATFAQELVDNYELSPDIVAEVFKTGTVDNRQADPGLAESAARQVFAVVDAKDGKMPSEMDAGLADIAAEYIDDIAYAANSPADTPLDMQDPTRPGIEMPFETARDMIYATSGSPDGQATLFAAAGNWQQTLLNRYDGDPNLQAAYGRELGGFEALMRGSIAARAIDDGRAIDAENSAARDSFDFVVGLIDSKGRSLTGSIKELALGWARDALLPESHEAAERIAEFANNRFNDRREAYRDAANYLLVHPENLEEHIIGQNPPRTVDISPQATIDEVESQLMTIYGEAGAYGATFDADFTEPDGHGGLRVKPVADMSAYELAAYNRWVSTPEVREVLQQQVTSQNQADDDLTPGTGVGGG